MKFYFTFLTIIFFTCNLSIKLKAQDKTFWQNIALDGQVGLHYDWYRMTALEGQVQARRPSELLRFMAMGSVGYKSISIPYALNISSRQTNLVTPIPTEGNFLNYLVNPYNAIGLSPETKYGKIYLGSNIPQHSSYTTGALRTFGFGADLKHKEWVGGVYGGITQVAVESDTTNNIQGSYRRRVYAYKFGYGKKEGKHLYISYLKSFDEENSVKNQLSIAPEENVVLVLDGRWDFGKDLYVEAEYAKSVYTANSAGESTGRIEGQFLSRLISINSSSRLGDALKGSIGLNKNNYKLKLTTEYLTPGFVTLGFPFMQSDRLDITLNPQVSLLNKKLNIGGSVGRRANNVSGLKGNTTYQALLNVNANWQLSDRWAVNANFSNFGFRNTVRNDTLRVENVSRTISISPSYTFASAKHNHVITFTTSIDDYIDYNIVYGNESDNNSYTALLMYLLSWKDKPLTADFTVSRFNNDNQAGKMSVNSVSGGINYQYFKKKMQSGIKLVYLQNQLPDNETAGQTLLSIQHRHRIIKNLSFNFQGSINLFKQNRADEGLHYRETLLQTQLIYSF